MKLIVQIPAFNEETTIAQTIKDIPRRIDGIAVIETLVIDDGSSDATADAARKAGAAHVVRLGVNRGLSAAFIAGIDAALRLGADVIVNTDADNQYVGADIATLVAPIVKGSADVVIGDRGVSRSPHMSPLKRTLQRLGSWTVSRASGISIPDVTSGFRAFSRQAAVQVNVFNPFTYTLETIIQSGNRNLDVQSVPVRTNAPTRPSRLYRGTGTYLRKSASTIFRIYTLYKPLKTFFAIGMTMLLLGAILGARFLLYFAEGTRGGHIQSLILAAVFLIAGFQTLLIGLVADLISVNRRLSEEVLLRLKGGVPDIVGGVIPGVSSDRKAVPAAARRDRPAAAAASTAVAPLPARPGRRERGGRSGGASTTPAAATPAVPAKPATNWVWLIDEDKLDGRDAKPEAGKPEVPKAMTPKPPAAPVVDFDEEDGDDMAEVTTDGTPKPASAGRRRRRRGGRGMRQASDLPGNRGKHLAGDDE